jgi:hypothetical protein
MFIGPIISGQSYDVQIRSLQANGASSQWVTVSGFATSIVLSVSTQGSIGQGSLAGEAYPDGTAGIECLTFTAPLGGRSVTYFPDVQFISGLEQQQLYYVYVIDPDLVGGDLTPVATQDQADYLGKVGYFLIGSIVTPFASSDGGTDARYYPSAYQDVGSRSTVSPEAAFDGDTSTSASVSGTTIRLSPTSGDIIYQGDPPVALPAISTLTVVAAVVMSGVAGTAEIKATINGAVTTMLSETATTAQATYTCSIPADTALSTITIEIKANPGLTRDGDGMSWLPSTVTVQVSDIYIQSLP